MSGGPSQIATVGQNVSMEATKLGSDLDLLYDNEILSHGFTAYARDYELVVETYPGRGCIRYLFKYSVAADIGTSLSPEVWAASLDPRLLDSEASTVAGNLEGHAWYVRAQAVTGIRVVEPSPRAEQWSRQLGLDFHEVTIETNRQVINLVFSELEVSRLDLARCRDHHEV